MCNIMPKIVEREFHEFSIHSYNYRRNCKFLDYNKANTLKYSSEYLGKQFQGVQIHLLLVFFQSSPLSDISPL